MDEELRAHIQKLREDFQKGSLDEKDVEAAPADQFRKWMQDAVDARIIELQAMVLSTVNEKGWPSSRVVYLREFGSDNFTFYTNYNSKKGRDLQQNSRAAINFYWPHLERQIRIEGTVQRADSTISDAYYMNRPFESQVGAWASAQSKTLQNRTELEKEVEKLRAKYTPETIKRPEFWGGLTLQATYYEFWQGRKSRLHDRICYEQQNNSWNIFRLSP